MALPHTDLSRAAVLRDEFARALIKATELMGGECEHGHGIDGGNDLGLCDGDCEWCEGKGKVFGCPTCKGRGTFCSWNALRPSLRKAQELLEAQKRPPLVTASPDVPF